jgi:class 3 adenylate cyclase
MLWNGPAGRISWAPDYPWGSGPDIFEQDMRDVLLWGTAGYGRSIAEWRAAERAGVPLSDLRPEDVADARRLHAYAKINRNTATPDVAAQIMRIHWETDVRAVLASVQVPTALVVGTDDNVPEAEYVASLLPNATLHVLPGRSGVAVEPIIAILRSLAGVAAPQAGLESVLGTVLFTDIVNSTQKQSAVGNQRWKELLEAHHAVVRGCLARWRGQETDTAGDGFYATFDGPARAIRCGLEIAQQVKVLDIEVRAGVHTGECEVIDGKLGGIAVTTGARISALAAGSQVLVSQTVKDLVAGSGLTFEDAGVHEIKGVPGPWHLYTVTS